MKFFNILLAQHNKFQYNAQRDRERGTHTQSVENDLLPRRDTKNKDLGPSLIFFWADAAASSSPFRALQFEFNLEQTVQLDLTCALFVTGKKNGKGHLVCLFFLSPPASCLAFGKIYDKGTCATFAGCPVSIFL